MITGRLIWSTVARLPERRVVRDFILQVELAEPAVGQMQLDFLTELAFRADAVAVVDNEHPDRQLGIDRGGPPGWKNKDFQRKFRGAGQRVMP